MKKLLGLLLFVSLLSSCGNNTIFEDSRDFQNGNWPVQELVDFDFNIEDTAQDYHLAYSLRNSLEYPYYNLYVQYELQDSLGDVLEKNLQELILMNPKTGEPLGRGSGDFYDHQFLAVKNYQFNHPGKYRMLVKHYMRVDTLPNIFAFGIQVLKAEKK